MLGKYPFLGVLFLSLLLLILAGYFYVFFFTKTYTNEDIGISLELPGNWKLEVTERFLSLVLEPRKNLSNEDKVSIAIWQDGNLKESLMGALEHDIERLKSVLDLDEINYIHPPKRYSNNGYEAIIATLDIPIRPVDGIEEIDNSTLSQPKDVIVIDGGDRFIYVFVSKSNNDEYLNMQADEIVNSIRLLKGSK